MTNTAQNHNTPQHDTSNLQPTDPNPNNPGFLMNGDPDPNHVPENHDDDQAKKKGWPIWVYGLIAVGGLLLLILALSLLSGSGKDDKNADKPTTEQPADPNLTQPPVVNQPNPAPNPAPPANPGTINLTPGQLDSLIKDAVAKAQPGNGQQQPGGGINQPGNGGQQQPGNGGNNGGGQSITINIQPDGVARVLQSETKALSGKRQAVGNYFRLPNGQLCLTVRQ